MVVLHVVWLLELGKRNAALLVLNIPFAVAHLGRLGGRVGLRGLHAGQLEFALLKNILQPNVSLLRAPGRERNTAFLHSLVQLSDEGRLAISTLLLRLRRLRSMLLLQHVRPVADQVGLWLRGERTYQATSQLVHLTSAGLGVFVVLDRQDCLSEEAAIAITLSQLLVQLQLHGRLVAPFFVEVALSVLPRCRQDGIKVAAKLRLGRLLSRNIPVLLAHSCVDLKCVLLFLAPEVLARVQLT